MGRQWAPKQFGVQSTGGARSLHQDRIPAAGEDFFVCAVASSFARLHLETIFLRGGTLCPKRKKCLGATANNELIDAS